MKTILHLESISDLYKLFELGHSHHPLVAVLDFSKISDWSGKNIKILTNFYSIMLKNYCSNIIKYGRKNIDFQDGNLICMAPNQVIEVDDDVETNVTMVGWGVFFHPDLLRTSALSNTIKNYSFFSYEISEALHLSVKEINILLDCVQKIDNELKEILKRIISAL